MCSVSDCGGSLMEQTAPKENDPERSKEVPTQQVLRWASLSKAQGYGELARCGPA